MLEKFAQFQILIDNFWSMLHSLHVLISKLLIFAFVSCIFKPSNLASPKKVDPMVIDRFCLWSVEVHSTSNEVSKTTEKKVCQTRSPFKIKCNENLVGKKSRPRFVYHNPGVVGDQFYGLCSSSEQHTQWGVFESNPVCCCSSVT